MARTFCHAQPATHCLQLGLPVYGEPCTVFLAYRLFCFVLCLSVAMWLEPGCEWTCGLRQLHVLLSRAPLLSVLAWRLTSCTLPDFLGIPHHRPLHLVIIWLGLSIQVQLDSRAPSLCGIWCACMLRCVAVLFSFTVFGLSSAS